MKCYRTAMMALNAIVTILLISACGDKGPELVQLPSVKPSAVLIKNVGVLDVETGAVAPNRDVLVAGDRIASVTPAGESAAPAGALEMDGTGATLLPGLIDMHGHVGNSSAPSWIGERPDPKRNMLSYLYCGVTTVLDPADLATQAFKRRGLVASGELLGPRIFAAGPMVTATGGHPVAIFQNLAPWWIRCI